MKVQYKKITDTNTTRHEKRRKKHSDTVTCSSKIHTEPISEAVKDDWTDDSSEEQGVELLVWMQNGKGNNC